MTTRSRRRCAVVLTTLCAAVLGGLAAPAGAVTVTQRFAPTGAAVPFDVPPTIDALDVVAVGGKGGDGGGPATGGHGARLEGTLAVTPGQRLWIAVGGNGVCEGGWNGGATGGQSELARALGRRRTVVLRLVLVVRAPGGRAETVTRTIRLVR